MRCRQSGFGLLEVMLALAIGLMVVVAAGQLLVSAHQSWRLQGAALRLQDDARLALLRMAQDIRMAGMFGCLRLEPADFQDPAARQVFNQPVEVGPASLGLVVAEPSGHAGLPDWTSSVSSGSSSSSVRTIASYAAQLRAALPVPP